jgi:hypothetical protein
MYYQDNVQTARVDPPALYGVYECKDHESWGDVSMCYTHNVCSRLPTQLEHGKEKKFYEELETGRTSTVVAPCGVRDRTSHICENEQKLSVVVERQREGGSKYLPWGPKR